MSGKVLLLKNTFKNNFVNSLKLIFVIISLRFLIARFLSNRNMIEVAQFLRNEAKPKSVESGFNIKLIKNNEMIGKLFNGDKLVYCNDIEELVAMVLYHRSQETNDFDIKLGVDGGQGFLKVTLSITLKLELENNKIPEKLSKCDEYAWKGFKDLSVH